mgnify:CR=1 FL=1
MFECLKNKDTRTWQGPQPIQTIGFRTCLLNIPTKRQKKQNPTGVDAAPTRNFPEVLADIEKKSLDF